jgi:sugar phosphate permease
MFMTAVGKVERRTKMKPGTIWIGIVLLAVGACGILDAAGVVDSSETIGQWWPLAIVGWAIAEMLAERRVTLGGAICTAIGTTLLADTQQWASDAVVWSSLAIVIGLAILVAGLARGEHQNGDAPTVEGGAS